MGFVLETNTVGNGEKALNAKVRVENVISNFSPPLGLGGLCSKSYQLFYSLNSVLSPIILANFTHYYHNFTNYIFTTLPIILTMVSSNILQGYIMYESHRLLYIRESST